MTDSNQPEGAKHTPEKWRVGFRDGSGGPKEGIGEGLTIMTVQPEKAAHEEEIIVNGGYDDWGVPMGVVGFSTKQRNDRATLIASAPQLLEALKRSRNSMINFRSLSYNNEYVIWNHYNQEELDFVEATIAIAEGRQDVEK